MKWFIIGVCCGIILGYGVGRYNRPLANTKYIYRDKYIRDSLYIVNDSIRTKIKYLNKIYYVKRILSLLMILLPICSFHKLHQQLRRSK